MFAKTRLRSRSRSKSRKRSSRRRSSQTRKLSKPITTEASIRGVVDHALQSRLGLLILAASLGWSVALFVRHNPALLQRLRKQVAERLWNEELAIYRANPSTLILTPDRRAGVEAKLYQQWLRGVPPALHFDVVQQAERFASFARTLTTLLSYVTLRTLITKAYRKEQKHVSFFGGQLCKT